MRTFRDIPAHVGPRQSRMAQLATTTTTTDAAWKPLYTLGAVAALISIACIPIAIVVFIVSPPPSTVTNWFKLYHRNGVLGLLDGDLMMLVSYTLMGVVYLALFGALRRVHEPFMGLAVALGLVSIVSYVASNPAFGMLSLSDKYYAAATTATERAQLLAAGQALLANWTGSAFDVSYVVGGVVALIIAMVMLRSVVFSRATAYVGLVVGAFMLLPATAGPVGLVASLISLLPTIIWLGLIAGGLFRLGKAGSAPLVTASPSQATVSRATR